MASVVSERSLEASVIRKASIRLIPFVAVLFFINFLDRTAISFSAPGGMNDDLGLTASQYGFAAGIFFLGYIVLEIPSNLALHRFGARKWLSRIMVTWGLVSLAFTWVASTDQLYGLRFLLGVAEAGFFPGVILFLSLWFPRRHRGKALASFYLAQPLTVVIGAPLASFLIQHGDGLFGLEGWRVMFLFVSIPAIVMGVVTWFYLTDRPSDASWLSDAERQWLVTDLAVEREHVEERAHVGLRSLVGQPRLWALSVAYFGLIYGLYALTFFL